MLRSQCDSHTDRDTLSIHLVKHQLFRLCHQLLRLCSDGLFCSYISHQDNKLIATDSSHNIIPTKLSSQQHTESTKYYISHRMSVDIIDFFKLVYIHDEKRMDTSVFRLFQCIFGKLFRIFTAVHLCQFVRLCRMENRFRLLTILSDNI